MSVSGSRSVLAQVCTRTPRSLAGLRSATLLSFPGFPDAPPLSPVKLLLLDVTFSKLLLAVYTLSNRTLNSKKDKHASSKCLCLLAGLLCDVSCSEKSLTCPGPTLTGLPWKAVLFHKFAFPLHLALEA